MNKFFFAIVFAVFFLPSLTVNAGGHDESGGGGETGGSESFQGSYNIIGLSRTAGLNGASFLDAMQTISGTGDLVGDDFSFTTTNTVNNALGQTVILSDTDINLLSLTGLDTVTSCDGAAAVCSGIPIGVPSVASFDSVEFTSPGTFVLRKSLIIDTGLGNAAIDLVLSATHSSLPLASLPALPAVTAVPVPAAAWLFGSALVGLLGMKRRN